jgi:uncharacterized protein YcgL (UPF0745 family)
MSRGRWYLAGYFMGFVTAVAALVLIVGCGNGQQQLDIDKVAQQLEERGYTLRPVEATQQPLDIEQVARALGEQGYVLNLAGEGVLEKLSLDCPGCAKGTRLVFTAGKPGNNWRINLFDADEDSPWSGYPLVFMGFNVLNGAPQNPEEAAWWHAFEANYLGTTEWNIDTHGTNGRDHRIFAMQCSRVEYNNCSWHLNGGELKFSSQDQYEQAQGAFILRATGPGVEVGRLAIGAPLTEAINLGNEHYIGFGRADEENQVVRILGFTKDNIVDFAPGWPVKIGGQVFIRGAQGGGQHSGKGAVFLPNGTYLAGNTAEPGDNVNLIGVDSGNQVRIDPDGWGVRLKGFNTEDEGGIVHKDNPNFRIRFGGDGNLYAYALRDQVYSIDRANEGGHAFRFRDQDTDIAVIQQDPATGETVLSLLVNDGARTSVRRVSLGPPDSCGTGFRCLRVEN